MRSRASIPLLTVFCLVPKMLRQFRCDQEVIRIVVHDEKPDRARDTLSFFATLLSSGSFLVYFHVRLLFCSVLRLRQLAHSFFPNVFQRQIHSPFLNLSFQTQTSPYIALQRRLQIASPKPDPPNSREIPRSACEKGSKMCSKRSGSIPIPVSSIVTFKQR